MNGNYFAFLIRFQRRGDSAQWFATLENAHTHEVQRFATVREVLIYLLEMLSEKPTSQMTHHATEAEADDA